MVQLRKNQPVVAESFSRDPRRFSSEQPSFLLEVGCQPTFFMFRKSRIPRCTVVRVIVHRVAAGSFSCDLGRFRPRDALSNPLSAAQLGA